MVSHQKLTKYPLRPSLLTRAATLSLYCSGMPSIVDSYSNNVLIFCCLFYLITMPLTSSIAYWVLPQLVMAKPSSLVQNQIFGFWMHITVDVDASSNHFNYLMCNCVQLSIPQCKTAKLCASSLLPGFCLLLLPKFWTLSHGFGLSLEHLASFNIIDYL